MTIWEYLLIVTPAVGAALIVLSFRLFPIPHGNPDQYEMDLPPRGAANDPKPIRPRSAVAESVDRMTDTIREELQKLRGKPKL